MNNKAKLYKTYNNIIRFLIFFLSYGYISYQLIFNVNYHNAFNLIVSTKRNSQFLLVFVIVVLLMVTNWSIETLKWRYLILKIEKVSFFKAFKAILTGLAVSTFTPNRVGEFLGRVFSLQKSNPWKAIIISILCSMSQLMTTFLIGSIGVSVLIFKHYYLLPFNKTVWILFVLFLLIINVILLSVYFNVGFISKLLNRVLNPKWRKIKGYLKVFSFYSFYELRNTLLMSISRYIVFSFQFYFLLNFFDVPLSPGEASVIIPTIYFIIAAIPSFAIAEIGIRGTVAVGVIDYYLKNINSVELNLQFNIIAATSLIWLINIALPALIGNIFVLKTKFIKTLEDKKYEIKPQEISRSEFYKKIRQYLMK